MLVGPLCLPLGSAYQSRGDDGLLPCTLPVSGAKAQSVGAHTNEPHVNGASQCKAPSVNHFKVDPPKLFDGKTLDGAALESWLY